MIVSMERKARQSGDSLAGASVGASDNRWTPAPLPDGVVICADTSPAKWIEDRVRDRPYTVAGLVPDTFEAYARVLHPAYVGDSGQTLTWAAVASLSGAIVHPLMQFERIAGIADRASTNPSWGRRPSAGQAPIAELSSVLERFTATADLCWMALWDGFGGMDALPELRAAGRARFRHLSFLLLRGPLAAVARVGRAGPPWMPPNLWWPDDLAWCVVSNIDLSSTYVGGTDGCIQAMLDDGNIEVMRSQVTDRVDVAADELNPPRL